MKQGARTARCALCHHLIWHPTRGCRNRRCREIRAWWSRRRSTPAGGVDTKIILSLPVELRPAFLLQRYLQLKMVPDYERSDGR